MIPDAAEVDGRGSKIARKRKITDAVLKEGERDEGHDYACEQEEGGTRQKFRCEGQGD